MNDKELIAARDPNGFRPSVWGRWTAATASPPSPAPLRPLGGTFLRDVEPGEVLVATGSDLHSYHSRIRVAKRSFCVFELVYFARPDSVIDGISIGKAGRGRTSPGPAQHRGGRCGHRCARLGYPRRHGLCPGIRSALRHGPDEKPLYSAYLYPIPEAGAEESLRIKLNAIHSVVCGKRIIMVDDSIVRGGTSARIVQLLREAGAKEVHVKVTAPPFLFPCDYGTAIPNAEQLAAHNRTQEEICQRIGADSLQYLSLEDVRHLAGDVGVCDACFTGNYVLPTPTATRTVNPCDF